MARFLHSTTLTWRDDDGTGAARDGELTNPDLSAVEAVPSKYWKVASGSVVEMSTEEKAVVDAAELDAAKSAKIAAIDARTPVLLAQGVLVNGESISCSLAAQHNLNALTVGLLIGRTQFPRGISTTSGGEYIVEDQEEFNRVSGLVWNRVTAVLDQGRALRLQVLAAATLGEVDAVEDSR